MSAVRVPWSSASFLAYLGGIAILSSTLALIAVQSDEHGAAGLVLWTGLIFVVLAGGAEAARGRGHFITGGLLAMSAVAAFIIFLGAILDWFGWLPNTNDDEIFFNGFHFWLLVLELVAVVVAAVVLRRFRFPLLVLVLAAAIWSFVFDLLSNGGGWAAIVSIAVGLAFLLAGIAVDDGPSRPFGFWLHVAAGLAVGGGLLWFFHDGNFDWIVIALVGLLYIALGSRLARTSWVVLGAWGMLQTAAFFADKWSDIAAAEVLLLPALSLRRALRPVCRGSRRAPRPSMGRSADICPHGARVHRACAVPRAARPAAAGRNLEFVDMKIGVLALQGNFREHAAMLRRLGAEPVEVRKPEQLEGLDGLVVPGGESTTFMRLMRLYGLEEAIRGFEQPILGTCAGLIVLDREHLGLVDLEVARNAYGRQVSSFEADLELPRRRDPLRGVFIRAPRVEQTGGDVEVLAELDGKPVLLRQGRFLVATFHPELTDDTRVHELFLDAVREASLVRT